MISNKKHKEITTQPTLPAIAMDIDWSAQHVLILGLGESGLACCKWLLRKGARITIIDSRAAPPMRESLDALIAQHVESSRVTVKTNVESPFEASWTHGMTMVIPGPGLSPHAVHRGAAVEVVREARERDLMLVGEIDLFEWAIHHATHASSARSTQADLELPLELPRVLAVTGTNGKTTTTQMTVALLRRAGFDVQEAGNISPSLLDAVMQREDQNSFPQIWVLELSSFQLFYARHFHPTAAALLNITEDHLDWHADMADYINAKQRVFGIGISPKTSGVLCVANRQDSQTIQAVSGQSHVVTFGMDRPLRCGDFGLVEEGIDWMAVRDLHDEELLHRLMPADALRVRGRHNAMNALAALALCRAVTSSLAPLLHGLREFRGGAHRMQWVAHVEGVDFVDDSKGTNVGATVAALTGLTLPVVLIAGGEGKGQDFLPLAGAMQKHAKAVVTIGKDGPAIARVAQTVNVETYSADSMVDAVQKAHQIAQSNAVVLLSPACASFDMYANYVERAHAFHEAVDVLAKEMGVAC